jgi:hypothetical protein
MFFIFGISPLKKMGNLIMRRQCPHCNDIRNFQEIFLRQYLSLFFIPVLPVSRKHSIFVCPSCKFAIAGEHVIETSAPMISDAEEETDNKDNKKVVVFCTRCEGAMSVPFNERNQSVICPHCSMEFTVKGIKGAIPQATIQCNQS